METKPNQPDPVSENESPASPPWYADGLKFHCSECGNCCTGSAGAVWVTDEDIQAIADYLDKPVGEIRLFHTRPLRGKTSLTEFANGDCTFFDSRTRGCQIYPVRPVQCSTWPFWNTNVSTEEAWKKTCQECPGAGTGDLISLEEIEDRCQRSGL